MELTRTNDETSFDPTPKLKSSLIPIDFVPFIENKTKCHCGDFYDTAILFEQKYCRRCLSRYARCNENHACLDIHISTKDIQCNRHEISRNKDFSTRNILEWCEYCSDVSYFKQIFGKLCLHDYYVYYTDRETIIESEKNCKLCGKLINNLSWRFDFNLKLCSDCYIISSGWTELSYKKPIPILYLPWWDTFSRCIACNEALISDDECFKYCLFCYTIYAGCRYCLTTNIIFGLTDRLQCRKCERILFFDVTKFSSGNYNIDEFLFSIRSDINNDQMADYIKNIKNSDPVKVYKKAKVRSKIRSESTIQWIPYDQINCLTKIAEGGFSTIYRANWLNDGGVNETVAIKRCLNSQDLSKYFLSEIKSLHKCYKIGRVLQCYGITRDPETNDHMLVMKYAKEGNLHDYLKKNFEEINWKRKIEMLWQISYGLETIHNANFIHRDFHSGNILLGIDYTQYCQIGDLGLSQPANITPSNNEIYGVIPYIAPEIFNGSTFSKESDIYSFGMIMWECTTGCKPFFNVEHGTDLIYNIIDGKRPEITNDTPECVANLMKSCWHRDSTKRPSITEIRETLGHWYFRNDYVEQFNKAEQERLELIHLKKLGPEFSEKPHSKAIFTSRPLRSLISKSSSTNSTSMISFNMNQDNKLETLHEESNNEEYISKEYELDINNIQSSSNTQHPEAIDINKQLSTLIPVASSSRKRDIEGLDIETQDNEKIIKIE